MTGKKARAVRVAFATTATFALLSPATAEQSEADLAAKATAAFHTNMFLEFCIKAYPRYQESETAFEKAGFQKLQPGHLAYAVYGPKIPSGKTAWLSGSTLLMVSVPGQREVCSLEIIKTGPSAGKIEFGRFIPGALDSALMRSGGAELIGESDDLPIRVRIGHDQLRIDMTQRVVEHQLNGTGVSVHVTEYSLER